MKVGGLLLGAALAVSLGCCRGSGAPGGSAAAPTASLPPAPGPYERMAAAQVDASAPGDDAGAAVQNGGGASCKEAVEAYVEPPGSADAGRPSGQYGAVLNRGDYFAQCNVPDTMSVMICAAVQHGRALGVSVLTTPADARAADCIARAVRRLTFPDSETMYVTRTQFAGSPGD